MSAESRFEQVLMAAGAALRPLGYRRSGKRFAKQDDKVLLLIEPQKSVKSTREQILFTFNLKEDCHREAHRTLGRVRVVEPRT